MGGRCLVSPAVNFRPAVRQRTGSRISRGSHPSRRGIQRRRQTVPAAISASGDYLRAHPVFHNWPSLQENLLCRSDWLRLRGIAGTECAILPIRELAPYPRGSACEHPRSGGAPLGASVPVGTSASRRIQLAARSSALVWEPGQSRQLLLRARRQYLRLRFGPLEIALGGGRRIVAKQRFSLVSPFVSLVCALPPRARVNMVTAERRAKNPLGVVQNIENLTNLAIVSPQTSWFLSPIAVSRLKNQQVQNLHADAIQTVGSRRSGTEPPREEPARTGSPLGTQHGRARHNPRGSRGAPRSRRDGARSLAWADRP